MKSSFSSSSCFIRLILLSLLLFFEPSNSSAHYRANTPLFLDPSSAGYNHQHPPFLRYCHPFPSKYPPSICFQNGDLYRSLLPPPPPQSPSSPGDEIDPRYGVEKRLVPGGPNPLHN